MKKIKAVIFDMDGLMIDSEPLHIEAFNRVFEKFGKHLSGEENSKRYVGIADVDIVEDMIERFDLPISPKQLLKEKQDAYRYILKKGLVTQPGLIDLLKKLHNSGFKIAIGSGSYTEQIEIVMKGLNISSLIDQYVAIDDVKAGKPFPDIYLLAAKKLEVDPSDCLVLEDAAFGVQAAKAAGMRCFAIPSQQTKGQDFSLADKVLKSLNEVFSLIES